MAGPFALSLALAAALPTLAHPLLAQRASPNALSDAICSANGCMIGQSAVAAGVILSLPSNVSLGANQTVRNVLFLPASSAYTSSGRLVSTGTGNVSTSIAPLFSAAGGQVAAQVGFVSTGSSAAAIQSTLDPTVKALYYKSGLFIGEQTLITASNTSVGLASAPSGSLILPGASFVVVAAGDARVVAFDASPDLSQWPVGGSLMAIDAQSTSCAQPCGIGGSCGSDGKCACASGFTGALCDQCAAGRFGPSCTACSCASGSICDAGITGTGRCLSAAGNVTTPAACGCTNGVCGNGNGSCSCNAGWADAPSSTPSSANPTRCSVCAPGFALSASGDCLACLPGCTTCSATRCTACANGLAISTTNAAACVVGPSLVANSTSTFQTCPDGSFAASGACTACDPACATCFGGGANQCLVCASPRVLLGTACVAVDQSSGICNAPSGLNGVFVVDNLKRECDALPAKCTAGAIPSFGVASVRSDLRCTACLPGSALSGGTCVDTCPTGQFAAQANSTSATAVCTACDSSCATCNGTGPQACTTCPSGSLLIDGVCTRATTCPTGFLSANSTACARCSPECASCAGSASTCTACPRSRPVLTAAGRCVPTCARGQFVDGSSCGACASSCATCNGAGASSCLSCPDGSVLKAGVCSPASCLGGASTVPGLGVCLESLLTITPPVVPVGSIALGGRASSGLSIGIIIGIVLASLALVALLAICCYRRHARKRRAAKTQQFAAKRSIPGLLSGAVIFGALKRAAHRLRGDSAEKRASTAAAKQSAEKDRFGTSSFGTRTEQGWNDSDMVTAYPPVAPERVIQLRLDEQALRQHESMYARSRTPSPPQPHDLHHAASSSSLASRNPFHALIPPLQPVHTGASFTPSIAPSVVPSVGLWPPIDLRPQRTGSSGYSMDRPRPLSSAPSVSLTLTSPSTDAYPARPGVPFWPRT